MKKLFFAFLVVVSLALGASAQQPQMIAVSMDTYFESLRADVRAQKVSLLVQVMNFSDAEGKIFWPVFRRYEADMTNINDDRVALVKEYLQNGPNMADSKAKDLTDRAIAFETKRANLHKKYVADLRKAGLSPLTIVKLMQFEHRFDLLVDLNLAQTLPPLTSAPAQPLTNEVPNNQ
jgi:hypothetical protein